MAKELPYFKFLVSEWLLSRIADESFRIKGLFVDCCAHYWNRDCDISLKEMSKKIGKNNIKSLENIQIIEIKNDKIYIKFLSNQYAELYETHCRRRDAGSKGGQAKVKPGTKPGLSIKDKDKEVDKDKKKSIIERKQVFLSQITGVNNESIILESKFLNDFLSYWTEHGPNDKKMRYEKQTSFDPSRRMNTWKTNIEKFKKNDKRTSTSKPNWDDFLAGTH